MSYAEAECILSTFTASDGDNLAVHDWPLPEGVRPRATVVLVHGLGEHAGRYEAVAQRLNTWGFAVRGYDQFGHGMSGGTRGALPEPTRLVTDLADIAESVRRRDPGVPLVVLGHSLGGLVAASLVRRGLLPVDGLVLSSPAFAMRVNPVQKMLLSILPRVAPNLAVSNGLDPHGLSHDPHVVQAYLQDPLVHDRISGRLAQFFLDEVGPVQACAPAWPVPTLLLYAGADAAVDPQGSRDFAEAAPRDRVTSRCFPRLYHEIFNEPEAEPVFACLRDWLQGRFPAVP